MLMYVDIYAGASLHVSNMCMLAIILRALNNSSHTTRYLCECMLVNKCEFLQTKQKCIVSARPLVLYTRYYSCFHNLIFIWQIIGIFFDRERFIWGRIMGMPLFTETNQSTTNFVLLIEHWSIDIGIQPNKNFTEGRILDTGWHKISI